jgi:signal transduction histidine kinase
MQNQNAEIVSVLVIGGVMALLLVLFIVTIVLLYQRRQQRHEKDLIRLKEEYDQELLRSQLEIQEKTLKTISQELHDNIGQMLSVVKMSIAGATYTLDKESAEYEAITASKDILNKAISDLSNLTKSLHTDRIAQIGLDESIHFEIETIKKTGLVDISFNRGISEYHQSLDPQTSVFLFRMFQEVINNTLKHSKATHVNVSINYTDKYNFVLKIEDNGVGFDVKEKKDKASSSSGVGLKSMINRAKLIGAEFVIDSKIGKGTTITITLPLIKDPVTEE